MGYFGVTPLVQETGYPIPQNTAIGNNISAFPNTTNIPATIYLQATENFFDEYSGVQFGAGTTTYDIYGNWNYAVSGQSPQQYYAATGHGYLSQWTVQNPYTWAQAAANAIALLGSVTLLSPGKVYQAFYSYNGGTEFAGPRPVNFCYGSEASAFANPTQVLIVTYTGPTPVLGGLAGIIAEQGGSATPVFYTDGGELIPTPAIGIPSAQNGNYVIYGYNPTITGQCFASACAVRTPNALLSETTATFTPGSPIVGAGNTQPINMPAGEYIFTPGEVPGFGYALWSTAAAPNLPPP
jgi:hypothetical protein